jgi:DNA topoisomerase-1
LPRKLGTTAAGEEITTNVGRFGPYVKYGAKYVSLKTDDPYEITPERALEVIREKEIADANRLILDFPDAGIQVLNGRYGPYITDKSRNAKIPKDKDPKSLTLDECQTLLAAAPVRTFGKWGKKNGAPKRLATPKGSMASGKTANGAAANANATAAGRKVKGAPIGLAAKAAKTAASKKAPAKEPAQAPSKAAAAPEAKRKAPPKSKKSTAQKKP